MGRHERYDWSFIAWAVEKRPLPVGDYVLHDEWTIKEIIDRKTFDIVLSFFAASPCSLEVGRN